MTALTKATLPALVMAQVASWISRCVNFDGEIKSKRLAEGRANAAVWSDPM